MSRIAPAEEWPEIDGVDSTDVREQLRGDARLFLRLLRRLVADYADLDAVMGSEVSGVQQSLAHKLKGASATLGVTKVFECARDAEQAAKLGDAALFRRHIKSAEAELDALRTKVAALAAPTRQQADDSPATESGEPIDLLALADLLRTQSLASLRRFDALELRLNRLLGAEVGQMLRDHIDHLRFGAAADLIESYSRNTGPF